MIYEVPMFGCVIFHVHLTPHALYLLPETWQLFPRIRTQRINRLITINNGVADFYLF